MAGVAGCLLAAQVGQPTAQSFQTQDSLTLLATTLIGGIFSLWGAVIAGCFSQLLPFLFQAQWGINPNFVLILFGAGLLQVLAHRARRPRGPVPEGHGQARPPAPARRREADRPRGRPA